MNRDIRPIKCTEEDYNKILVCITMIFMAAIVNFDYIIISKLADIKTVSIFLFIINFLVINISKKYLFQRNIFTDNLLQKRYLKCAICLNVTNILNVSLYAININVHTRDIGVFVVTILFFVYAITYVLVPVVDIANGMELYLKKRDIYE